MAAPGYISPIATHSVIGHPVAVLKPVPVLAAHPPIVPVVSKFPVVHTVPVLKPAPVIYHPKPLFLH